MAQKSLFEIQNWIQGKILENKPVSHIESEVFLNETEEFSHKSRWNIYQYAIWERQLESLEQDFPVSQKLVGVEFFRKLLTQYLTQKPSSFPSLSFLSQNFAEFINAQKANLEFPWLAELIKFESLLLSMEYVSGGGFGDLSDKLSLLELISPESLLLRIRPDLILLSAEFPIHEIYEQEIALQSRKVCLAIYSEDREAYYNEIDKAELEALTAAREGATLIDVLACLSKEPFNTERIFEIFQKWVQQRWIVDIKVSERNAE